ncbi:MAG: anti-sigma factor domain-containing protein [Thermanaeromonas sp.]|uniref:anti-sigma factor domain-containing protein n=1 Tax=Thermanaeromonas sp. TaxID=2003697 RepID=UPI0024403ACE|nr:anti-sigma factor domain-containing protein [Thermanaeromonas sp.]MCG0277510.1 anti-sigma factor domain-containing protein [Thermanaeromonas sp.]
MGDDERGLVLDIQGKEVIVLTPQGEFRRVKAPHSLPGIGEEITLPSASPRMWVGVRLALAVAALIFLAFGLARVLEPGGVALAQPSFYVAVDINPSIELAVDKEEKVIEASPLNADGKDLLEGLKLKGQKVQDAIRTVTRAALEKGYLKPGEDGFLMISVISGQEMEAEEEIKALDKLAGNLARAAEEIVKAGHVEAKVKAGAFNMELREEAAKLGLSTGKYALYLKTLETGVPITVEELKEKGMLKTLRSRGADPGELLDSVLSDFVGKGKENLEPGSSQAGNRGVKGEDKGNKEGLAKEKLQPQERGTGGKGIGSGEVPKAGGPSKEQEGLHNFRGKGSTGYSSKDVTGPGRSEESKGGEKRKGETGNKVLP